MFIKKILRNDKCVRKYTGMQSIEMLNGMFQMMERSILSISSWRGPQTLNNENTNPLTSRTSERTE